jgi:hypothetical protein
VEKKTYPRDKCPDQEKHHQQPEKGPPRMQHVHARHEDACDNARRREFVPEQGIADEADGAGDFGEMVLRE